jgi:hypothetical protein
MEPICSPFGLGASIGVKNNPLSEFGIPTCRQFNAGEVFVTRYRIEVDDL